LGMGSIKSIPHWAKGHGLTIVSSGWDGFGTFGALN
jgi:hypothetical protein